MTLMAVFIAAALGHRIITRPLRRIVTQARNVGAGDLSVSFDVPQGDEIGALSSELNNMVRQLAQARAQIAAETERRLRRGGPAHRPIAWRRWALAAGVAHELETPLHVATGRARRIAALADAPAQATQRCEVVRAQCERMRGIVHMVLDYARRPSGTPSAASLTESVRRVASMLEEMATRHLARLQLRLAESQLVLPIHAELFEQALINLVVNAFQAMPNGGAITISASQVERRARAEPMNRRRLRPGCAWACRTKASGSRTPSVTACSIPFFTYQGGRPGHGARPLHRLRHRCSRARRLHRRGEQRRPRGSVRHLSAARAPV